MKKITLPLEEIKGLMSSEHPHRFIIALTLLNNSMMAVRGDLSLVHIPYFLFTPTANGIRADFTDVSIIDYGQTIKLGSYEAAVDSLIDDAYSLLGDY